MKNWYAYIQVNGEEVSIFEKFEFPVPERLFQKIQTKLKEEIPLCDCDFYDELIDRARNAFDLTEYITFYEEKPEREDYDDKEEYLEALEEYNEELENTLYSYCEESLVIDDPGDNIRFKRQFIGKVYPDFAGTEEYQVEAEEYEWGCVHTHATIIFDEHGMVKDIVDIYAEGLESESVKSSSWGNAYPDYEALEEALEDELGYPDEDEIDW